jgi:hypothetical protein
MAMFFPMFIILLVLFEHCDCSKNALLLIGDSTSRLLLIDALPIFCPGATNWKWLGNYSAANTWGDGYHRTGQGFSCSLENSPFSHIAQFHFFGVSPTMPYFVTFNQYLMTTDFPGLPMVRTFVEPKSHLLCSTCSAAFAIQQFMRHFNDSTNIHVVMKSVLWDIGRLPWIPPPMPAADVFYQQYIRNASSFISFVKKKFPNVNMAWQTSFPGTPTSNFTRGDTGVLMMFMPYAIGLNHKIREHCHHPHHGIGITLIDEDALTNCAHVQCTTRDSVHLGVQEYRAIGCHVVKKLVNMSSPMCRK